MNLKRIAVGCVGALALLGTAATGAQTISRGEVIAATCYTCHGTHGVSPSAIPSIDYIPAARIVETLKAFKSGTRYSTIMGRHASAYTDEEIVEAANFLASLQKKGK
jgi:sulfide dehydrogenase cytochrome subunit